MRQSSLNHAPKPLSTRIALRYTRLNSSSLNKSGEDWGNTRIGVREGGWLRD